MAYIFGDGFDLYTAPADTIAGYWDSGNTGIFTLGPGRFTGSRALANSGIAAYLVKSSGQNDAVHHVVVAFEQTTALTGSVLGPYISLSDGATAQCSIVFRQDGAILLTSGGAAGTALATYTGAVTLVSQWFVFEFEVVINNTTGSFTVRKNGNTSNDFTATSLNTRGGTANNYANRLTVGQNASAATWFMDDFLWRSDAASVPWVGDIRCYTRMPASDAQAQFTRNPVSQALASGATLLNIVNTVTIYQSFVPLVSGTLTNILMSINTGWTGNLKCALYNGSNSTTPTTVVASAITAVNPATGTLTITWSTPPTLTGGAQYFIGFISDTNVTNGWIGTSASSARAQTGTTYAAFPTANPIAGNVSQTPALTATIAPAGNWVFVSEALQDGATTYVYDSNVGDADFYGIAALAVTPASIVAVTTRGFLEKSDAGSRSGAMQLKSGGTTVSSGSATLSTTWAWMWRTDTVDPATSATWTPAGVNAAQIGPIVTA